MQVLAVGRNPVRLSTKTMDGLIEYPSTGSSSSPVQNLRMWGNVTLPLLPPTRDNDAGIKVRKYVSFSTSIRISISRLLLFYFSFWGHLMFWREEGHMHQSFLLLICNFLLRYVTLIAFHMPYLLAASLMYLRKAAYTSPSNFREFEPSGLNSGFRSMVSFLIVIVFPGSRRRRWRKMGSCLAICKRTNGALVVKYIFFQTMSRMTAGQKVCCPFANDFFN